MECSDGVELMIRSFRSVRALEGFFPCHRDQHQYRAKSWRLTSSSSSSVGGRFGLWLLSSAASRSMVAWRTWPQRSRNLAHLGLRKLRPQEKVNDDSETHKVMMESLDV